MIGSPESDKTKGNFHHIWILIEKLFVKWNQYRFYARVVECFHTFQETWSTSEAPQSPSKTTAC